MKRDASHLELQAAQLYEELFKMEDALLNRGLLSNEDLCKWNSAAKAQAISLQADSVSTVSTTPTAQNSKF